MADSESKDKEYRKPTDKADGVQSHGGSLISIVHLLARELPSVRGAPFLFSISVLCSSLLLVGIFWWFGLLIPGYVSGNLLAQNNTLRDQIEALRNSSDKQVVLEGIWPTLTNDQVDVLKSKLIHIQETELLISCDELSCRPLAISLLEAFRASGWSHAKASIGGIDQIGIEGITINPIDESSKQIRGAIESSSGLQIALWGDERPPDDSAPIVISIGQLPFKVK